MNLPRRPRLQALASSCLLASALACGLAWMPARADIVVGQTIGVTGQAAATVKEALNGAMLWIEHINAQGGIKGEKIQLLTLDDEFDVQKAAANARVLIEQKKAVVLFMNRGTPHTEAIMPLLQQHGIALVAPSTGAMLLHNPVQRYIFNVRAPYQREAEKAIEHLHSTGTTRIAVVHVDDSFGRDALEGATKGFAKARLQPVAVLKADREKPAYASLVPALMKAETQAVLWVGSSVVVAEGVKALRAAGSSAQVVTLSNNASAGFVRQLGDASRGVIVSQVYPGERAVKYPLVQEALKLAKAKGYDELTPAMLEGFAAAKVLAEALRQAAPQFTREKVLAALEGLRRFDLGGLELSYGPGDHSGLDFADLSIIGVDGRFVR
ncbi:ABC transporter substrate-binding protein [Mitsuaria sp. WAJ17]|uniref:ABC transporter substrate-binding protein n=1 Tax=Mitsuaria sp. WAJ17 TaxID=2761452 RepID=UPI0015FF3041|nr:ABC transporter substrate-binding protein [Mitsuaria sp. WAJ17]MBB2487781.1 ABC transporter substrate-binding protein [Mitsuaria sp. WAJ17]